MTQTGRARLHQLLRERYDTLKAQIAQRLGGAADLADDALHDAYLRLASQHNLDQIQHPHTYLVNTAVNSAIDRLRRDARQVSDDEIDALFERTLDEQPGAEQTLEARQRVEQVVQVMASLPVRQYELLVAHRIHHESTEVLAQRWGITARMVRREIQSASAACLAALKNLDAS